MIPCFAVLRELTHTKFFLIFSLFLLVSGALVGCESAAPTLTPTPAATVTPAATPTSAPTPTATQPTYPWVDASAVMAGICFESAYDAAGRSFVLRTRADLERFYDLADNSGLCRRPVGRGEFSFADGAVLAGIWTRGEGCDARHEVEQVHRDDAARTLFIFLRLVTEGDCDYELVQPFWITLKGLTDYQIQFVVEQEG